MDRYALNTRTLGAGISVPQTYWSAAIDIIVFESYAEFTQYTGVLMQSSVSLTVSSVIDTIRTAAISADLNVTVSTAAAATRVQFLLSRVTTSVSSSFTLIAGLLQKFSSNVLFGAQTVTAFTAKRYMQASQAVQDVITAVAGTQARISASQVIQVTSTSTFTSFGEYAPAERYIIVEQEDRDTEVV
jgi:hypothetical protein